MRGIELSKGYFEEYGRPLLESEFADIFPYIAVGYVGSGSDRYGYDDEISQDHDFEPGFCIFIPGENVIDRKRVFQLERAYAKLPKEYKGFTRQIMSPVGGNRNGVIEIEDFYLKAVGSKDGNLSLEQWLTLPDYALAEAVNGQVYLDNYGEFTRIREIIMDMPRDIRLKRIAGNLLIMAQAGQYNYTRCLKHGEIEAAQIACNEFVDAALKASFLLQSKYMPYYKWSFRALSQLEDSQELTELLSYLLMSDHRAENIAKKKYAAIENVATYMIVQLNKYGLTKAICGDLEKHAYSVNDKIDDGNIRNMNILAAI
ncbi:MAG: DUF4037 domain-containing protein [Pseudobutyrivibrio sp.]|nr:DUF4037 domain-containing protein [Pseudobutyrivibrio sp.]